MYGILGPKALGTGIMVDNEGLLTNCHVLAANMPLNGKKIYAINAVTKDYAEITDVAYLDNQDACLLHAPGLTGQAVAIGSTTWAANGLKTHIGYANGRLTSSPGEFLGWLNKWGQNFLVTSNYCTHGVSGGPLVDNDGKLLGLTSGGPENNHARCYSLTVETVRSLRFQSAIPIADFPADYVSNIVRRTW